MYKIPVQWPAYAALATALIKSDVRPIWLGQRTHGTAADASVKRSSTHILNMCLVTCWKAIPMSSETSSEGMRASMPCIKKVDYITWASQLHCEVGSRRTAKIVTARDGTVFQSI